jgi:hypothetical protein
MKLVLPVVLVVLTVLACTEPPPSRVLQPIIDIHMHARTKAVRTPEGNPASIPCFPEGCEPEPTIVQSDEDVLALALEAMDRNNVVLAVVSDGPLERVYEWVNAAPNRFLAGQAIFNPSAVDPTRLRAEYEAGRLQVMGEIAVQYSGVPPNDPSLEPFFALAEELDLPTLIHCGGVAGASPRYRLSAGHPEKLEEVLLHHPKLRLWVENAGRISTRLLNACTGIPRYMLTYPRSRGSSPDRSSGDTFEL